MRHKIGTLLSLFLCLGALGFGQQGEPKIKLFATKVELNGEVKLAWTKLGMGYGSPQYDLYRAKVSDSSSFTLIASTTDTSYVDKIPAVITDISNSYAYYVSVTHNGMTDKSNTIVLPVPGIPPIGSFRLDGYVQNGMVNLTWEAPPVNTPVLIYLVLRGRLGEEKPMFTLIDSTTALHSETPVPPHMSDDDDDAETYVYVVRAIFAAGDPLFSTTVQLTFRGGMDHDRVTFVSKPSLTGQLNVPYYYKAVAVSSDSTAVIRYRAELHAFTLLPVITPFVIDSVTGDFSFTPISGKGYYEVEIIAKSSLGGRAKQEFTVAIGGGNGIIQGKVTDTLDAGISNVIVQLYKVENSSMLSFAYSARTDDKGNYRISRIDPGHYKLRATAPSLRYESQWYDGVHEVSEATVISVADSPSVTIANFKLRGGPLEQASVRVSGTVSDTLGLSLFGDNSRVFFVRAEFALNFGGGLNVAADNFRKFFEYNHGFDFRLEGNSEFVTKTRTDSSGHYNVDLAPGKYVAFAKADGYAVEFFNGKDNLLAADIITVTHDTAGVDFTLSPLPPVVLGEIKGSVMDSAENIGVPSRVIAFRDGWRFTEKFHLARVYVTDTDSSGMFTFSDVLPGTYVIMAVPLGGYAPAFYSSDTSGLRWKMATKIEVNGNSVDDITIYVRHFGPYANGYTRIHGNVAVNGAVNGTFKAGTIVYALRNHAIAGYAITDANGNFSIEGLSPGGYSVLADKPGFEESAAADASISYSTTGEPMDATVNLSISSTTGVTAEKTPEIPASYALTQNYPNPFNPMTTIGYALPQSGVVSLKVYNIIGQEVATLVDGYQAAGVYAVSFNARSLSSGVYFYRLQSGNYAKVKKMMLVK